MEGGTGGLPGSTAVVGWTTGGAGADGAGAPAGGATVAGASENRAMGEAIVALAPRLTALPDEAFTEACMSAVLDGGDAATLYRSTQRILALPDEMRLFMCHDYGPNGRDIHWETTVGDERRHNIHVGDGISEAEFVAMRETRDKTLGLPRLIIPSIQVNIRGGELPPKDKDGRTFLKVPVNTL